MLNPYWFYTSVCRLYACEFQALFELDRVPRWGECLPGVTPISHTTDLSKATTRTALGGVPGPLGVGTTARDSGVMPPTYEEDRDNGEGGTVPADDNTFVLPLKLSSCRVLLPQVGCILLIVCLTGRFLYGTMG